MADLHIAKARKRIKTIGTNITDGVYTITAGNIHLEAPFDVFSEALAINTPRLHVGAAQCVPTDVTYPLIIPITLEIFLPESATFTDLDNLCEVLAEALLLAGNYPAGEKAAHCIQWEPPVIAIGENAHVKLTMALTFPNPFV